VSWSSIGHRSLGWSENFTQPPVEPIVIETSTCSLSACSRNVYISVSVSGNINGPRQQSAMHSFMHIRLASSDVRLEMIWGPICVDRTPQQWVLQGV
jgi:hypothetical protein